MIRVRPYQPADRAFVLSLAPRLTIGIPPWSDPQRCIAAVQGWVTGSAGRVAAAAQSTNKETRS